MSTQTQRELRLPPAPRSQTVELLHRTLGDVLVPIDLVRSRYFRNLNDDNFTRAVNAGRIALPIITLDASAKAAKFIDIRHLAIFIDTRADAAEFDLTEQP